MKSKIFETASAVMLAAALLAMTAGIAFAAPSAIALSANTVAENNANPTVIGTVSAACGGTCSYALGTGGDTGSFSIHPDTGVLSITHTADFEVKSAYTQVQVTVTDSGDSASASQTFTINVSDVNEAPSFSGGGNISVAEDSGVYPATAWAGDLDDGDPAADQSLTFHLTIPTADTAKFLSAPALDAAGRLSFTPAADANGVVTATVTLTDDATINGTAAITSAAQTFTISITPLNDAPQFTAGAAITVACDLGSASASGWATDISDGDPQESQTLSFSADLGGISGITSVLIDAASGDATINLTADCGATGTKTIPITLTDNGQSGAPLAADPKSRSDTLTVIVAPVYSISGRIIAPWGLGLLAGGTQVTFGGYSATANLLTGAYSIGGIPGGTTATLIPSRIHGGYTFAPAVGNTAAPITLTGNLSTENFTASGTRSISGTITGPGGARLPVLSAINFGGGLTWGAPLNGVSATTAFSINHLPPKTYILKPATGGAIMNIQGGKLSPAIIIADTSFWDDTVGNDFTFNWSTHIVSGTLKTPSGTTPIGKTFTVRMVGTGAFSGVDYTGTYKAGAYTVGFPSFYKPPANNDPAVYTGSLVISGAGYQSFAPLAAYAGASNPSANVIAYGDRSIFGGIGAGLEHVTINFGGGLSSVAENGYFILPYLERKSYSLTPTAAGFFFTPSATNFAQVKLSASLSAADADLSNKFTAWFVPKPLSPANGARAVSRTPTFIWEAVPGASGYTLEYSTNSTFPSGAQTITVTSAGASYVVPGALNGRKVYYWRVKANGLGSTEFSNKFSGLARSFTTAP